ncbi:MAG: hypothetical protein WCD89_19205 [Anaerocolumna sp.]
MGALDCVFKLTINKEEILKILCEVNQKLGKSSKNEMESVVRKNRQAIKSTLIKMLAEKTYIIYFNINILMYHVLFLSVKLPAEIEKGREPLPFFYFKNSSDLDFASVNAVSRSFCTC